jgi:hypothetical protein
MEEAFRNGAKDLQLCLDSSLNENYLGFGVCFDEFFGEEKCRCVPHGCAMCKDFAELGARQSTFLPTLLSLKKGTQMS